MSLTSPNAMDAARRRLTSSLRSVLLKMLLMTASNSGRLAQRASLLSARILGRSASSRTVAETPEFAFILDGDQDLATVLRITRQGWIDGWFNRPAA